MTGTHLSSLPGANPLGFLAALGVQALFDESPETPLLWWTNDVSSHAVVDGRFPLERIIDQAMTERNAWMQEVVLNFEVGGVPVDDVKLSPDDTRRFLATCRDAGGRSARLAAALIADSSLDNSGVAKPTDLHFTAGQQKFLRLAREVVAGVESEHIVEALTGPWLYKSKLPSFMWDVTDDRVFALSATNPSDTKKLTVPGAEFLALMGLSRFPVFAGSSRTLTTGCSGRWKRGGEFRWPLWRDPAGPGAVAALIAHAGQLLPAAWPPAWGVDRVLVSSVRRADQGGYGSFGPPQIVWERSEQPLTFRS